MEQPILEQTPSEESVKARYPQPGIDEYLRERLMPVEGAIPHIPGIDMYGNSIPAGTVGGDLYEYINFQQRYDIEARIRRALNLSKEFLKTLAPGTPPHNFVDEHVEWLKSKPNYRPELDEDYREAKSSEQIRVAENLRELNTLAGVLLVDAQGHGIISAKIASTVHDTFHAFMLSQLDRYGRTTPMMFENINLRLAQSVTARNALGTSEKENAREIATMLYGEVHPYGYFRFVNYGHPPPLVFSAEYRKFMKLNKDDMVQFLPLGLQLPEDHPDRNRYFSMEFRHRMAHSSDISELTLMGIGDILFLYTDGVYDGTDEQDQRQLEEVVRQHSTQSAKDICNAVLRYAVAQDDVHRQNGEADLIDDKTAFIIKRT
jgi:serine phosphatase RsbU (regulator of sigma subunit)